MSSKKGRTYVAYLNLTYFNQKLEIWFYNISNSEQIVLIGHR